MAKAQNYLSKLKTMEADKYISVKWKIRVLSLRALVIFMHVRHLSLDVYLQQWIASFETIVRGIDYRQHVTNETVRNIATTEIGNHQELLEIVKTRKLKWFGHTTRGGGLAKTCLQGTVRGGRGRGRPRKKWSDNISEWTCLSYAEATRAAERREGWRGIVREAASSAGPLQRAPALRAT